MSTPPTPTDSEMFRRRFGWLVRRNMQPMATSPAFATALRDRADELYRTVCGAVCSEFDRRREADASLPFTVATISTVAESVVSALIQASRQPPAAGMAKPK